MTRSTLWASLVWCSLLVGLTVLATAGETPHPLMTWVKRHPPEVVRGLPPPRMGYETSYGYDPLRKLLIRYAGHNQGGGGEQNSEVWTYDLDRDVWTLKEPNDAPPGVCCAQQNVFHDASRKFIRFPAFSGSHGWQSPREINLKNSSVWTYDLGANTWRAMRPWPEVWPTPLRGAAYDPHHQVTVLHGGEGARHGTLVYDLYANTWHEREPREAPPNFSQPGFAYDAVHRLFVLFGSQFADDPRTWTYDLRKNEWRILEVKEHPPANQSCPVMAADTQSGVVLCSVIGAGGLETWALDVAKPEWRRLKVGREPDTSGHRNRVLLYLPDRNLFVLENRTKEEQQIWTFRYAEVRPVEPGPRNLRVVTESAGATLAWEAPPGLARRYDVYRGAGAEPWKVELTPIAKDVQGAAFRDKDLRRGAIYFYQVRSSGGASGEEPASALARTQPPTVVDLWVAVPEARRAELHWVKPDAQDTVGYHVERAEVRVYSSLQALRVRQRFPQASDLAVGRIKGIGPFRRLNQQPIADTRFVDDAIDLAAGQKEAAQAAPGDRPPPADQLDPQAKPYRYAVYAYRVVAVNRLGVQSGPSPWVLTLPSAPQHVFAKEEGKAQTRLKWQASREKSVTGYHVYRHDGRWDKDTISRLTSEPIAATEFVDEKSGESTRRYEIVAVDRLGQEGEPSQPVWSRREWGRFYVPYVGPWHQ